MRLMLFEVKLWASGGCWQGVGWVGGWVGGGLDKVTEPVLQQQQLTVPTVPGPSSLSTRTPS